MSLTAGRGVRFLEYQLLAGAFKTAFRWWTGELGSLLPKALMKKRAGKDYAAVITPKGWHKCGLPASQWPANSAVTVYISPDLATHHTISLPIAARRTLRTVVGYEMDRITPFPATDVYFTCEGKPKDGESLSVDVYVVPKALISPALEALRSEGLHLECVDIAKNSLDDTSDEATPPSGLGLNLLSDSTGGRNATLTRALGIAIALLFLAIAFAGWSVFQRQAGLIEAYEARLVQLRDQLSNSSNPQDKQDSSARHYAASIIPFTLLMDDITKRLGDDTHIFALRLDGERLTLSGASLEAAGLLTALDASPFISEPAFSAPIVQDPATGYERFSLSCKIAREEMS